LICFDRWTRNALASQPVLAVCEWPEVLQKLEHVAATETFGFFGRSKAPPIFGSDLKLGETLQMDFTWIFGCFINKDIK
jgi:hypothetical protein